jgi:16S rRNA (guanine966-N2)-methyltransferase
VFSSLGDEIIGATFFDLFAGSGAMGCEAVSRGASRVVFIDHEVKALGCLKSNTDELLRRAKVQGLVEPDVQILRFDMRKILSSRMGAWEPLSQADIVYVDPPYDLARELVEPLLVFLDKHLAVDGVIVFESRSGIGSDEIKSAILATAYLEWIKSKTYGQTAITVCRRKGPTHG